MLKKGVKMNIKDFVIEKLGRQEGLKFLEWAWPEEFNDPFDPICLFDIL